MQRGHLVDVCFDIVSRSKLYQSRMNFAHTYQPTLHDTQAMHFSNAMYHRSSTCNGTASYANHSYPIICQTTRIPVTINETFTEERRAKCDGAKNLRKKSSNPRRKKCWKNYSYMKRRDHTYTNYVSSIVPASKLNFNIGKGLLTLYFTSTDGGCSGILREFEYIPLGCHGSSLAINSQLHNGEKWNVITDTNHSRSILFSCPFGCDKDGVFVKSIFTTDINCESNPVSVSSDVTPFTKSGECFRSNKQTYGDAISVYSCGC